MSFPLACSAHCQKDTPLLPAPGKAEMSKRETNKRKRPKHEYLGAGLDSYLNPFFHATAEPCPQSHTGSTARAQQAQFVSIKPTTLYQGATEDLLTQHIFHLHRDCIEHGLIRYHQPQLQHQCNLDLHSHIFISNQFIFIYSIKGGHVHRATSILPR